MTNGNADRRMTAEEFDLAASMILLEGGHNRKAASGSLRPGHIEVLAGSSRLLQIHFGPRKRKDSTCTARTG